jgi:hypothetical protein
VGNKYEKSSGTGRRRALIVFLEMFTRSCDVFCVLGFFSRGRDVPA